MAHYSKVVVEHVMIILLFLYLRTQIEVEHPQQTHLGQQAVKTHHSSIFNQKLSLLMNTIKCHIVNHPYSMGTILEALTKSDLLPRQHHLQ
jgi:hypothetical protein